MKHFRMTVRAILLLAAILTVSSGPVRGLQDTEQQPPGKTTTPDAAAQDDKPAAADNTQAPPENPFPRAVPVPAGILDGGAEWLNTAEPLSMKDLRGKIVLLDFWTYCCINCMHVLPDLKYLEEKYAKQLVVIGVHSAKFDNEKLSENIRNAMLRYEIQHPVVNDNEMLIWRKFGTQAWPTLALVDPEGNYIGSQSGEGNRELFDTVIGKLVEYHRWKGTLDENPIVFASEQQTSPPTPLRYPGKVFADAGSDRVFVTDTNHNRIVVTTRSGELLETIGSGRIGSADGSFTDADFDHPQGTTLIGQTLYVADTENHLLRAVDLEQKTVRTVAGTGRQGQPGPATNGPARQTALNSPWSVTAVNGTVFIAMAGPHQIWAYKPDSDLVGVYAGSGREDVINGSLSESAFAQPSELVADAEGHFLYVVDSEGSAVRRVPTDDQGTVTTIAGTSELPRGQSLFAFGDVDGIGADARLQHPLGIALDAGQLYVADSYNHKIRTIDTTTTQTATWLGTGEAGAGVNPAQLNEPGGLSIADGKLFIADTNNHRVCVVNLKTKEMTELSIPGLMPPSPPRSKAVPDEPDAIVLSSQSFRSGSELAVTVALAVPAGYKLNDMSPVTWEVFAEGEQTVIPGETIAARDEATVEGTTATFRIPLTAEVGDAKLLIRMSYGFCAENSSVCKLATAAWRVPVTVSEDAESSALQLSFPAPKLVE